MCLREEGEYICEQLSKTNRLVCVDMVEVNPILSDENGTCRTADMAIDLLKHIVGKEMKSEPFERDDKYTPEGSRNV